MSLASLAAASGVRTMGVAIRGDASSLTRELARSAAEIDAWEAKTSTSLGRWGGKWKIAAAGTVAGIAAIVSGLTMAGLAAVDFEKNMRNVNSLLLVSNAELSALSTSVLEIAREVPQTAENLAEGLYNIASSGFEGADGLLVLDAAARAASAGLATTDTAAQVTTAVLNAYGLSAASATDVTDVLFSTVNYGVVEFDELAGSLGTVLGMASAAKVPIADVGAAIATMTLTGVQANEASTSLNRVIQALIQPSESLAAVYEELGYESGTAALEAEGLYGVMEELRQVTDGNADATLRLFPEVRAMKGALALASDEGSTYADIQAKIGDETARAGATQTAFAEQMESTSARWSKFTSSMKANTIAVGLEVIPIFNGLLDVMNPMANEVVPTLASAWDAIAPHMSTVRDIGEDLWGILEALYQAAEPIAGVFAGIAAAIAGMGLDILLSTLEVATGFLNENRTLAVALAAAYASKFLPSIAGVVTGLMAKTAALRSNIAAQVLSHRQMMVGIGTMGAYTGRLAGARVAMLMTASSARAMGASFMAAGGPAMILTAGIVALVYAAQSAGNDMRQAMGEITSSVQNTDISSLEKAVEGINEAREGLNGVAEDGERISAINIAIPGTNFVEMFQDYRHNRELDATNEALEDIGDRLANANLNLVRLYHETGLEISILRDIVETQGIDITDAVGTEEAAASRQQVADYIADIEKTTGDGLANIANSWQLGAEEIEAFAKAQQEAVDGATQAFMQATDVIGSWKPDIGVEEEKNALEGLAEAREHLNELESDSESSADQLKSARESLVRAEEQLTEAQRTKAEGTLEAFYQNAISMSESFTANLDEAVRMGLDPQIMARLLQEGPEQAGPIVEQMVADNSGALIEMVNDAESALGEINYRIAEQARITARAIAAPTDELTQMLPQALEISALHSSGMNADEIARAIGVTPQEATDIAESFGFQLRDAIQASVSYPSPYEPDFAASLGLGAQDGAAAGRTYGENFFAGLQSAITNKPTPKAPGVVGGPTAYSAFAGGTSSVLPGYTPGRDVHRFYSPTAGILDLSGGEGIGRPEFVSAIGPGRWDQINAAARSGGVEGVRRVLMRHLGGFANGTSGLQIRTVGVPINQTLERHAPINIERYIGSGDPGEIDRMAARRRSGFNAIGGGG